MLALARSLAFGLPIAAASIAHVPSLGSDLAARLAPNAALAPDRAADVRACLDAYSACGFHGAIAVARGDTLEVAAGLGLADAASGRLNTPDTRFEIASITKSFTAVAILQLEAAGKLALDDSIAKHLPGVPADRRDITLLHLLTHTSGMPRSAAISREEDLERAVAGYLRHQRARAVGAEFEYWNGGYALLAGVIERVTERPYVTWMREHVLAPAGMTRSGFTGDAFDDDVAVGVDPGKPARSAVEHPYETYGWHYRGMGGLVSTASDLARFARALSDDTLLPAKQRERLFKVFRGDYACGFYRRDEPRLRLSHGGEVRGFHANFALYPSERIAIVVLSNAGDSPPPWTVAENLEHLVFGDKTRFPLPPRARVSADAELAPFAGEYAASEGERISVECVRGGVRVSAFGPKTTLALAPTSFGEPEAVDASSVALAQRVVSALAKGETRELASNLAPGIPARWPDDVVKQYWPERIAPRGAVQSVHVAGAIQVRGLDRVLLRLVQEHGESNVELGIERGRVKRMELSGPRSLAIVGAVVVERDRLQRFEWQGDQPAAIEVVRASGRVSALRINGTIFRRR